jgi:hypothetical protein
MARHAREDGAIDKTTKIGLMVTGGVALVVLVVIIVVRGKKADERHAIEKVTAEVTALRDELRGVNLDDETAVNAALKHAKEKESVWKDSDLAVDIQSLVGKTQLGLDQGKERRQFLSQFDAIEGKLRGADKLTGDKLKEMRRELDEIEGKVAGVGADVAARYALARTSADKLYAQRVLDEAKEYSNSNADNPRLALVRSQVAEDEIRTLLDRTINEKNTDLQAYYQPLFEQAVAESDRLASALFTPAEIDKTPWTDCLSGAQVANWNPSDVKGFAHQIAGGVLQLVGPDADAGRTAVISIGDREQWRNFVADMKFTIERGGLELYFHLGRSANANTPGLFAKTEGDNATWEANRSYKVVASIIGSNYLVRFDNAPDKQSIQEALNWRKSRKGGIGLFIPPGAKIKFTKFQVRDLR